MNTNQDDTKYSKNSLELLELNLEPNTPIISDVFKESVNAVLSLFRRRYTQSND